MLCLREMPAVGAMAVAEAAAAAAANIFSLFWLALYTFSAVLYALYFFEKPFVKAEGSGGRARAVGCEAYAALLSP